MAALYMLFCGDVLRHALDPSLRTFSIALLDWFTVMRDPRNDDIVDGKPQSTATDITNQEVEMKVNFIQLCRNDLPTNHSWTTQKGLKFLYDSATASFVDVDDCVALDVVASVRVLRNGIESYHPLLVCIKCASRMTPTVKIRNTVNEMKELLDHVREDTETFLAQKIQNEIEKQDAVVAESNSNQSADDDDPPRKKQRNDDDHEKEQRDELIRELLINEFRCPAALCLLVLMGDRSLGLPETHSLDDDDDDELSLSHLGCFPDDDTFRMIHVPDNDPFGVSDAVREIIKAQSTTEVYSSHGYVYGEDGGGDTPATFLQSRKSSPEHG